MELEGGDAMTRGIAGLRPGWILFILGLQFAVLLALLVVSFLDLSWFPSTGAVIGGVFPWIVPWAAALGGASHAMYSVSYHWKNFRRSTPLQRRQAERQGWEWNAFYLVRVLLGCVFGTVAALIVVWVTKSIDVGLTAEQGISTSGKIVLFVIAFVVGFQQDYFKELLKRVAAILLTKPETGPGSGKVSPDQPPLLEIRGDLQFGDVDERTRVTRDVNVANLSDAELSDLSVVIADPSRGFSVTPDTIPSLPARAAAAVTVTFAPTTRGRRSTKLSVIHDGDTLDYLPIEGSGRRATATGGKS
ncbi:hypothetical protein [Agromyces sp. ZXT2-3]|uniref:hypothetical protein n=1 Tax=Agromyces sp. ZXT2-3 TaxID=3461152 RepID=UPI004054C7E0